MILNNRKGYNMKTAQPNKDKIIQAMAEKLKEMTPIYFKEINKHYKGEGTGFLRCGRLDSEGKFYTEGL